MMNLKSLDWPQRGRNFVLVTTVSPAYITEEVCNKNVEYGLRTVPYQPPAPKESADLFFTFRE